MIDLAGSENAKETGATGQLLVEAKHINQSLIALSRVISTLIENKRKGKKLPVPFRETELTNLLRDVLSGDFVCTLILNASSSPVFEQAALTAKTMSFGEGVKKLQVNAKRVQELKDTTVKNWLVGVWNSVSRKRPPNGAPPNAPAGTVVSAERRARELKEEEEEEKNIPALNLKDSKSDMLKKRGSVSSTEESKWQSDETEEDSLPHPTLDPYHPNNLPPQVRARREKLMAAIRERRGRVSKKYFRQ